MKQIIPRIMVFFMSLSIANADLINWENFNSTLLIEVTRPTGVFTCTGVAIKDDIVLTAAHCLDGEVTRIRVSNQPSYNPNSKFWTVKSFELHPEYDQKKSNYHFDLAKIKLTTPLPISTKIYPIMKKDSEFLGEIVRLGYGARFNTNTRTIITPQFKMLHTADKTLELNDEYSFSGDSGGPVFIIQKGQMYLAAIHSTLSYGPQGKFSYNPLLSTHRSWITQ